MDFMTYLIFFIIIYLFYVIFVITRKKALEKFKTSTYVNYLVNVYKIKVEKINSRFLANMVSLTNAFILSTSLYVICNASGVLQMILAVLFLFALMFFMYHILGLILKRKGDSNEF